MKLYAGQKINVHFKYRMDNDTYYENHWIFEITKVNRKTMCYKRTHVNNHRVFEEEKKIRINDFLNLYEGFIEE